MTSRLPETPGSASESSSTEGDVPARIVLSDESFDGLVELLLGDPPAPTPALRKLMQQHED